MKYAYILSAAFLIAATARGQNAAVLQCGRDNPMGEGRNQMGIGHVPMKVTSDGLMITFHYPAYKEHKEREFVYRVRGIDGRSLSLVRVDSLGKEKAENTAIMSFDPALALKSEGARNASIVWTDSASAKPPVSTLVPGKTWFFCTNIDEFLKSVREKLGTSAP